MIKIPIYNKCCTTNFKTLFANLGYAYFTNGMYNLNIIGVRRNGGAVTNKFDDYLIVIYNTSYGEQRKIYSITTEPGKYYMQNPMNVKGTAIVAPGQYRGVFSIGRHKNQYKALVQRKPIKVYRDGNKDLVYDLIPECTDEGMFGINIHRSNPYIESKQVDKWSAGCQVFANPNDFKSFMNLCEKQKNLYGDSFTYTLINEKDLYKV